MSQRGLVPGLHIFLCVRARTSVSLGTKCSFCCNFVLLKLWGENTLDIKKKKLLFLPLTIYILRLWFASWSHSLSFTYRGSVWTSSRVPGTWLSAYIGHGC